MAENERQRFVAYRSQSDEAKIRFCGGPLDGSSMTTDEFPTATKFVHQVGSQRYIYRYMQVAKGEFTARFDGFEDSVDS